MSTLPDFDPTALNRRFLAELHRLYEEQAFSTYHELTQILKAPSVSYFAQLEKGRYTLSTRLLYNLMRHFPQADLSFIVLGGAATGREEPTTVPNRPRGHPHHRPAPANPDHKKIQKRKPKPEA